MESKRDIRTKPYKILIVDDDPLVIKILERLLYKKNFLFFSVTSGERALEVIYEITPDIILLDVLMANMDGYDVCKKLKKNKAFAQIPVIFLTSNTTVDDIVRGFKAGAVDYVVKPFNASELLARLEIHLELKRSREEIMQIDLFKTKFFSIMTNDIKNSILGLKGVANFLLQELREISEESSEAIKLSNILVNDSSELYKLLENLLEWASIELGQKQVVFSEINVGLFLEMVIAQFDSEIKNKELSIEINSDFVVNKLLPSNYVEAILQKFVSNAIKYTHKGGKIVLEYEICKNSGENVFTVTDNGVGMVQEVAENFFLLDAPIPKTIGTFNEKGPGVGLIICKTLTERIDGTITINSARTKGTKISLRFPDPNLT